MMFASPFVLLGVQMQHVFEGDLVPRVEKPPHTLDSTVRYDFQVPVLKPEFAGNLTRYGCNKNKYRPAVGAGKRIFCNYEILHSNPILSKALTYHLIFSLL